MLATSVLVFLAVLPLLAIEPGVIGLSEIGAAVSAGWAAGVVAALFSVLVWRHRDFPRRSKLPPHEQWLTDRYLASIGETRERATSSGADSHESVMLAVRSTSPGERSRVLPVVRDLIPRQVVGMVLLGLGGSIAVPLVLLGLLLHASIWSLLTIVLCPGLGLFLIPKLIEGVGFHVQIRDWLAAEADATR